MTNDRQDDATKTIDNSAIEEARQQTAADEIFFDEMAGFLPAFDPEAFEAYLDDVVRQSVYGF